MSQYLHIGTIRRAHGLRGQVKVAVDNIESEVLDHIDYLWTGSPVPDSHGNHSQLRKWQLSNVRPIENGVYIVTLDGLNDRSAAEALQLQDVYAARDELPALSNDEVYHADLIGCQVLDPNQQSVGSIRSIETMNGNFLLVVERPNRDDALVPFVPQIVTNIDLTARMIEIDPPEGLLDLDRPGS
jgi:16S rRNA processing protein RimM